jgi:hypothetical protein
MPVLLRCRRILRHCWGSVMTASTIIGERTKCGSTSQADALISSRKAMRTAVKAARPPSDVIR